MREKIRERGLITRTQGLCLVFGIIYTRLFLVLLISSLLCLWLKKEGSFFVKS